MLDIWVVSHDNDVYFLQKERSIEGPTVQNAESAVGSNDCGTTAQPEDQNHTCMEEIEEHCWVIIVS